MKIVQTKMHRISFLMAQTKRIGIVLCCLGLVLGLIMTNLYANPNSLKPKSSTDLSKAKLNQENLFDKGLEFYRQGKYEMALLFLEKSFESNLLNSDVYFYLGNLYYHTGEFKKAILFYNRGIQLKSESSDEIESFLYNLALTYYRIQDYAHSLDVYARIEELARLKKKQVPPMVRFYQGVIFYLMGNKEKSIYGFSEYLKVAKIDQRYHNVKKLLDWLSKKGISSSSMKQSHPISTFDQSKTSDPHNTVSTKQNNSAKKDSTTTQAISPETSSNPNSDSSNESTSNQAQHQRKKIDIDRIKVKRNKIKLEKIDQLYPKKKEMDIPDEIEEDR